MVIVVVVDDDDDDDDGDGEEGDDDDDGDDDDIGDDGHVELMAMMAMYVGSCSLEGPKPPCERASAGSGLSPSLPARRSNMTRRPSLYRAESTGFTCAATLAQAPENRKDKKPVQTESSKTLKIDGA